jgi:outer membrane protein assembly factor BamA
VGDPLNAGLGKTVLCRAFDVDEDARPIDRRIASALDYRVAADFLQPQLFGTRNSVGVNLYSERISELGLYLRRSTGARVGLVRSLGPGTVLSTTLNAERGATEAGDEFFCIAFEVCTPEDIEALQQDRWTNSLSVGLVRNRVRLDPFPSAGYAFRAGTDYASQALGSDDRYLRLLADGTVYRELRKDWVVSVRLLGGTFLQAENPLPPERRFYSGGPTTVRGFGRNALGPTVYIARPKERDDKPDTVEILRSATGGTRTVLASAELTAPSPVLARALRVAAFVDAGQVWGARSDSLLVSPGLRITPGVGVRAATPVGPIRLDLAYNPYAPEPGPLYRLDSQGNLIPGPEVQRFRPPEDRGIFDRITLHVSVGQTF